jgi:hypothetical protein
MLDMAFQLLTFFVLTYRPAPQEGQFIMSLLPPQPATEMAASAPEEAAASNDIPATLRTLPTVLRAGDGGTLLQILVAENEIPMEPQALEDELVKYFQDPDLPFDQTLIKVDPRLKYSELMTVINAFSRAFEKSKKEPKLSFVELNPNEGG